MAALGSVFWQPVLGSQGCPVHEEALPTQLCSAAVLEAAAPDVRMAAIALNHISGFLLSGGRCSRLNLSYYYFIYFFFWRLFFHACATSVFVLRR